MSKELECIKQNTHLVKSLCEYVKQHLGFHDEPSLSFILNQKNAENPLGKTAYYSPDEKKVVVYVTGRHIKDILRSLAHELVHHSQHCRGEFANMSSTKEGYAQRDDHLREMEREAYEVGNMLFRDFEDGVKQEGE